MVRFWRAVWLAVAAGSAICGAGAATAQETVKIGAILPLTGVAGPAGSAARAALEIGAEIVDKPHQGLGRLPLGAGNGLPGLHGAKIELLFADHQANLSVGVSQALRLIAREKIVAMIGAGQPAVSLAAVAAADRRGIPFVVPDATPPSVAGSSLEWVFRTAPDDADFAGLYAQFLAELKAGGSRIATVGLVFENSDRGAASAGAIRDAVTAAGFTVVADIGYTPNRIELSPQVTQLSEKRPDAVIAIGATADAILLAKTMKTLDYRPPLLIGDDAGFSDPAFVAAVGNLAQGVVDRRTWSRGAPDSAAAIVDDLYKAKTGRNLDDAGAQALQGFFVLADAINRAGSTEPAAIQQALRQTALAPEQLIVGYRGVKFDATGRNLLASSYLTQLQGKDYVTIWPTASASTKPVIPYKGWK